jgi:hypothetical protein
MYQYDQWITSNSNDFLLKDYWLVDENRKKTPDRSEMGRGMGTTGGNYCSGALVCILAGQFHNHVTISFCLYVNCGFAIGFPNKRR